MEMGSVPPVLLTLQIQLWTLTQRGSLEVEGKGGRGSAKGLREGLRKGENRKEWWTMEKRWGGRGQLERQQKFSCCRRNFDSKC